MSKDIEKKAPPIKFLLECSDADVADLELTKLGEAADLRSAMLTAVAKLRYEMLAMFERIIERTKEEIRNQEAIFDQLVDASALALLAAKLRTIDREELKRQLLESSTVTLDAIMAETKAKIRDAGRSREEAEGYAMRVFPPGVAHRNASKRYQAANIAEGKCEKCPEPLDPNSIRYCTKHLAMLCERGRKRREKKGALIGMHGKHPNTQASLAMNREKKTRALLAELGIAPESAAVSLKAAIEALLKSMPQSKADAMTQAQLFQKAGVVTKTTGQKALYQLLYTKEIRRFGKGGPLDPYRYFKTVATPPETRKPKHLSRTKQNSALLKMMHGEETNENESE